MVVKSKGSSKIQDHCLQQQNYFLLPAYLVPKRFVVMCLELVPNFFKSWWMIVYIGTKIPSIWISKVKWTVLNST